MCVFLDVLKCLNLYMLSQEESYDLQDRKDFAKFLIDADIRLVSWKSYSVAKQRVLRLVALCG